MIKGAAKRITLEVVGWLLVVAGIAALVLPGPGLLMLFGGLAVLSQQYEWAEKRVAPIERRAKTGAAESVETWPRIILSSAFAARPDRVRGAVDLEPARTRVVADQRHAGGWPAASPPASPRSPRASSRSG